MTTPARREYRDLLPDPFDLFETRFTVPRPAAGQAIRVEELTRDDRYVVRAEIPGIDPDRDLELSVSRDVLTIRVERRTERATRRRSEFRYGCYERHLGLPENVRHDEVRATYDKGILTVAMPFRDAEGVTHRIPVEQ